MAKRKEVILQEVLNTQEAWDNAMCLGKLYVIDAHQKWCGPCTAITGMLKRIKNELGDDLLKFATAEVDSIDSLDQYRGKCEPNFLFFASGELVGAVRGCNAPLIQQTIHSTLEMEHKVLNGEAERKVIRDIQSSSPEQDEDDDDDDEVKVVDEGVVPKQVTVALIKPDVVQNEQVDEILEKITQADIEVLANEERLLTEEQAREFYQHKSNEEFFEDLIKYVTSGPCRVLVLTKGETGKGIVDLWRDVIGPFDAAVAKEENENSLRAIYGVDATSNALHGSTSEEEAAKELAFFFPDFELPTFKSDRPYSTRASSRRSRANSAQRVQKTLAIIRPDALKRHKDAVLQKIEEAGFKIAMQKEMVLSNEQAENFYSSHKDEEYFEPLVKQMTCGPVLVLCLARDDAVEQWRKMLGPKIVSEAVEKEPESLRAQFNVEDAEVNMFHGSDSPESAEEELSKLFNVEQTLAVIKPDAMSEKEKIMSKLHEAGFIISCQKDSTLTREIAEEIYKSKEGADYYETLIDHMTSGNTLTLVLSAEDAVEKLRSLMGPIDPEVAKTEQPDSLRALFAKSILENAIHSSSSKESAQEKIRVVFGETKFEWDGSVMTDSHDSGDDATAPTEAGVTSDTAENTTEAEPAATEAEHAANEAEPTTTEAEPGANGEAAKVQTDGGARGESGETQALEEPDEPLTQKPDGVPVDPSPQSPGGASNNPSAQTPDGVPVDPSTQPLDGASDVHSTQSPDGASDVPSTQPPDGASDVLPTQPPDGASDVPSTPSPGGASDVSSTQPPDGASDVPSAQPPDDASDVPSAQPPDDASDVPSAQPLDGASDVPLKQSSDGASDVPSAQPLEGASDNPSIQSPVVAPDDPSTPSPEIKGGRASSSSSSSSSDSES